MSIRPVIIRCLCCLPGSSEINQLVKTQCCSQDDSRLPVATFGCGTMVPIFYWLASGSGVQKEGSMRKIRTDNCQIVLKVARQEHFSNFYYFYNFLPWRLVSDQPNWVYFLLLLLCKCFDHIGVDLIYSTFSDVQLSSTAAKLSASRLSTPSTKSALLLTSSTTNQATPRRSSSTDLTWARLQRLTRETRKKLQFVISEVLPTMTLPFFIFHFELLSRNLSDWFHFKFFAFTKSDFDFSFKI